MLKNIGKRSKSRFVNEEKQIIHLRIRKLRLIIKSSVKSILNYAFNN